MVRVEVERYKIKAIRQQKQQVRWWIDCWWLWSVLFTWDRVMVNQGAQPASIRSKSAVDVSSEQDEEVNYSWYTSTIWGAAGSNASRVVCCLCLYLKRKLIFSKCNLWFLHINLVKTLYGHNSVTSQLPIWPKKKTSMNYNNWSNLFKW